MYFKMLRDDEWFDEIRVETADGPVARIAVKPRYKTSGMSGDEWRTSATIHLLINHTWKECRSLLNLEVAAAALYPELFNHPALRSGRRSTSVDFFRKGALLYSSTYDDKPLPVLRAAGHLPWALIIAGENSVHYDWDDWCFQPGCARIGVSLYQLKKVYSRAGEELVQEQPGSEFVYHRRFCKRHLLRGNASFEDGDDNYIVVEGPGPDQAEGWEEDESPAVFGGVIDMRG